MKLNSYITKKQLKVNLLLFLFLNAIYFICNVSEFYKRPVHYIEQYIDEYPQDNVTLVTALYLIKSKHSIKEYIKWMKSLLMLNTSIVFFTHKLLIDIAAEMRPKNLHYKTKFIVLEMEDFYSYKHFFKEFNETYKKELDTISYLTPPLYLVWAEKAGFLKKAIKHNYFNSSCFYWIDVGYFRDKSWNMSKFVKDWPSDKKCKNDPRVLLNLLRNFTEREINGLLNFNEAEHIYLQKTMNTAGGLFGGRADFVIRFCDIYYNTLTEFYQKNIYIGKEQNIFTFIGFRHPEIVNLIYTNGDYYYFANYLS